MNQFDQWEVGRVAPSKDDRFTHILRPEKCNFAVNKKVATNSEKCIKNLKSTAITLIPFEPIWTKN